MLSHYRFVNHQMTDEIVMVLIGEGKKKTKHEVHREVNVVEHDEASARRKARREKYENLLARQDDAKLEVIIDDLSPEYKLEKVFELGTGWNRKD
jgi:hypothetical protein